MTWKRSLNLTKVLWCGFQQYLGTFTILLVQMSSQIGLSRHLYDYDFGVANFGNTKSMRVIFFLKIFQVSARFQKSSKNSDKFFCFWDNCIWIGIVKLSLLRTGYFSSAPNVLTNSNKILQVNKRDLFQLNWLGRDQWIW